MQEKLKYILPLAVLGLLLYGLWLMLGTSSTSSKDARMLGGRVPEFYLAPIYGDATFSNSAMTGQVSLLHFWASWCAACATEHDMLMRIKDEYKVAIFGIAFKDDPNAARDTLNAHGNPYVAVGADTNGDVGVMFGLLGVPETFIISPSGTIIFRYIGVIDQSIWDNKLYPIIRKYQK
jgi:cytochrome c biogenesis protein CcmG/thiol:disulfide interchange protein DsbE